MKSVNRLCDTIKRNAESTRTNERGNTIYGIHHDSERYAVDFADDFSAEGWEQFDTDQDAHYFGCWVNRQTLQTLTYAEGDWSLVCCSDSAHYNAEVSNMIEFYGEGYIAKTYTPTDSGNWRAEKFIQDRQQFLIA